MDVGSFVINVGCALLMGTAIGLERQLRQHAAALRTNALVCVGAALFVSLSKLMGESASPTRMASYVVSGIGFLGGGVILREGLNVRGMSTAATLWCTAAIGSLSGSGFPLHAFIGAVTVLGLNLALRPLSSWIDNFLKTAVTVPTLYRVQLTCETSQKTAIRNILLACVNDLHSVMVQRIAAKHGKRTNEATIVATLLSAERNDQAIEELISRMNLEPSVIALSWDRTGTTHD